MIRLLPFAAFACGASALFGRAAAPAPPDAALAREAVASMRKAATFFREKAAAHGGYVFYYSPDFLQRWGEGAATSKQAWVQPPGTPTVGLAFLKAHAATGEAAYLEAAREAAEALVFGQLESGGWANVIDFDPAGARVAQYRGGRGRGRNQSSLDDGTTQEALRLLMHADRALGFKHAAIHEASETARAALLAAQFPSGGFPQGWAAPSAAHPPVKASYPDYDWRTENRIKEYWDLPTLNDGLAGTVAAVLADAVAIYGDARCAAALRRLGDFLVAAQMPEPQPGWAQQYDHRMRPVWARKFEPPAVAGRESQDAVATLLLIHRLTGDAQYLAPIPRALAWLRAARLPDGQLARYYELQSNRPLYMTRAYELTHDDGDLPAHYGWKTESKVEKLAKTFAKARQTKSPAAAAPEKTPAAEKIRAILRAIDGQGRWLSIAAGQPLVGQPKFPAGMPFIASAVFAENLETLSAYVAAAGK